ncbi:hypothetical protein [Halopiger goleimassiliensis]|uniref:hypothetical protein n=1 Tax=Halopiger goleimassiliensis TaxID=1293048 RepID=UPI0012B61BC9|nr:hypothetical protein [Halopiger goleimassiliensis]
MTHRGRRRLLAGAAGFFVALAPGCLDAGPTTEETSDDSSAEDEAPGETDEDDREGNGAETDDPGVVTETPRVDEPPHEIDRPAGDTGPDEWDEEYLGAGMSREPTLAFDVLEGVELADPALQPPWAGDGETDDGDGALTNAEYAIRLLETRDDLESIVDLEASETDGLETVDFDDRVVVIVESGWGSSSIVDQWVRVETDGDALHLHGYRTDPPLGTTDVTTRHSVLVIERPDDLAYARASLTVSPDRRVHFNSTEGVVSLED